MSYIVIKDYCKNIKKNMVLKNINIELEQGKIYGFIGRNGSGKTMLLRAVCGLIKPTSGYVKINNDIISQDIDYPKSCGVVIENPGFWDDLTGLECLKIISRIKNEIDIKTICVWMERFELNPSDKKPYRKYSLGMKQKLALIQAFMESPELILLDEPTNSLDDVSISILRTVILEQKERGATILISSHNKEEIQYLSDRIFLMKDGTLSEDIEKEKI